jgi:hypothetical protein
MVLQSTGKTHRHVQYIRTSRVLIHSLPQYCLDDKIHPVMGAALHICLPSGLKTGNKVQVKINYRTKSPDETDKDVALQWLSAK